MLKITVAVPTYNRGKSIRATLEAIAEQKFPRDCYELIVVDDGGKDSTKEIVSEFSKKSGFSDSESAEISSEETFMFKQSSKMRAILFIDLTIKSKISTLLFKSL